MGTYARQGSFTLNTATGNQSISGLPFAPKAVLFWVQQFATKSGGSEVQRCYGGSTGSQQFAMVSSVNAYNHYVSRQTLTTRCIRLNDALTDAAICNVSFVSLNSNGFTINVLTGASITINYLAIGGSDVKAKVGFFDIPAQVGGFAQAITGVGFKPKALMTFCGTQTIAPAVPESVDAGDGLSLGFAAGTGTADQEVTTHWYQDSTPLAKRSNQQGYCVLLMGYNATVLDARGRVQSFDNDGFTMYFDTKWDGSTVRVPYLALGGDAQYKVGAITEPSATGTQVISTPNMKPITNIFMSVGAPHVNGAITSTSRFSFGASSNLTQHSGLAFTLPDDTTPSTTDGYVATNTTSSLVINSGTSAITPPPTFVKADPTTTYVSGVNATGLQSMGTQVSISSLNESTGYLGNSTDGLTNFAHVNDPDDATKRAFIFQVAQRDTAGSTGGKRTELSWHPNTFGLDIGSTYWAALRIRVGSNIKNASASDEVVIYQCQHNVPFGGLNPNIGIVATGGGTAAEIFCHINYSTSSTPSSSNQIGRTVWTLTNYPANTWITLVFQFKLHYLTGQGAFFKMWKDGTQVVNDTLPNAYNGGQQTNNLYRNYHKIGIYHYYDQYWTAGQYRTIYHKGIVAYRDDPSITEEYMRNRIEGTTTTTPAWESSGNVTATSTGNFTVNWSAVSGQNYRYSYLAIADSKSSPAKMMIGMFN